MKTIGIIGAMEEEIQSLKPYLEIISTKNIVGTDFYMGKMAGHNVVIVRSGIGKVNASICTQILIDLYAVDCIINVGVAGAVNKDVKVGDIVIANDVMYHDMLVDEPGIIPRMDESIFKCDSELFKLGLDIASKDNTVHTGRIVSGDIFLCDLEKKNQLWTTFKAFAVDMESAAIGHTSYLNKIPFLIIRSISDTSDDANPDEFEKFFRQCAIKASDILQAMVQAL